MSKNGTHAPQIRPFFLEATYSKSRALRIAEGNETEKDQKESKYLLNPVDGGVVVINDSSDLRGKGVTRVFMGRDNHLFVPVGYDTLTQIMEDRGVEVISFDDMAEIRKQKGPM